MVWVLFGHHGLICNDCFGYERVLERVLSSSKQSCCEVGEMKFVVGVRDLPEGSARFGLVRAPP